MRHMGSNKAREFKVPLSIIEAKLKLSSWDTLQMTEYPH